MINLLHTATVHKAQGEKFKITLGDKWETTSLGVVTIADIYRIDNKPSSGRILVIDSRGQKFLICAKYNQGRWWFMTDLFICKL